MDVYASNVVETTQPPWRPETLLISPIVMESGQVSNSTNSPTGTLTSCTILGSPDSPRNSSNIILTSTPPHSSSPVEISSSTPDTSLYCPFCDESFHAAKYQDNKTNLQRHIQTIHTPDRAPYRCTIRGCDKTYPRSDNLRRHLQSNHGLELDPYSRNFGRSGTTDT